MSVEGRYSAYAIFQSKSLTLSLITCILCILDRYKMLFLCGFPLFDSYIGKYHDT